MPTSRRAARRSLQRSCPFSRALPAVGALLVAGLANARAAKGVNTTVGAVYLLLGIVGCVIGLKVLH